MQPSIRRNYIYNVINTVLNVAFPLITFPYISRILLVEMVGKFDFATAVINYFIMFASLGIPTYGIRACARVRDNQILLSKTVHELLAINIVTTILTYMVFLITLKYVPQFWNNKEIILISSINLLLNALGMNWFYSALEKYQYITIRSMLFKLISLLCIFLMIHEPKDYLIYAGIHVFSISGSYILNFLYSRKLVSYKRYKNYNLKQHIIPVITFFATSVAISIYTNLDVVMLGMISGDTEVGYYSAAMKIRAAVAAFVTALSTVLLPRLSFYAANGQKKEFEILFLKSLNFTILTAVPLTLYFIFYSKSCIVLLSGSGFAEAAPVLRFLIPTVLLAGTSNVTGTQLLVPWGNENKLLVSIVCGAVLDFFLNIILIPHHGAQGAAFATLMAECMVLFIQIYFSRDFIMKQFQMISIWKKCLGSILAASLSLAVSQILPDNLLLHLAASFFIFISIYFLFLFAVKEELILELLQYLKKTKERFL